MHALFLNTSIIYGDLIEFAGLICHTAYHGFHLWYLLLKKRAVELSSLTRPYGRGASYLALKLYKSTLNFASVNLYLLSSR